jgi:hypothetical protein
MSIPLTKKPSVFLLDVRYGVHTPERLIKTQYLQTQFFPMGGERELRKLVYHHFIYFRS